MTITVMMMVAVMMTLTAASNRACNVPGPTVSDVCRLMCRSHSDRPELALSLPVLQKSL